MRVQRKQASTYNSMAKINSSVNIVEVCIVTPPPGSALPASLPLTFFDILMLRYPPVESLYFYKFPTSFNVVVSNLKTSLTSVLQHYLPLAGTMIWPENAPKPTVETLIGDGVLLTVAESSADFDDLVSDGLGEVAEFQALVPELRATESRAAMMAVQVTSFGSHVFCIGITTHHAIQDGRSATSFIKFWARECKSLVAGGEHNPTAEMMPFYDRSVIADPEGLQGIYLKDFLAFEGPNNRSLKLFPLTILPNSFRGTFRLNPENIQKLKQFILNHQNSAHPLAHISTLTVVMAYTWVCIAVADNSFHDGEMILCVTADVRRRLNPPVPENYFGNCIVDRFIPMDRAKLVAENGVVTAVEGISKAIKSFEDDVLNGAEECGKTYLARSLKKNVKFLEITGSPRFELYGVDFGWGTPEKVVFINGTESVSLCEGRDGGVELGLDGTRVSMETFAAVFAEGLCSFVPNSSSSHDEKE